MYGILFLMLGLFCFGIAAKDYDSAGSYIGNPDFCKKANGIFPNPYDCSKFFHCANGINYVKPCAEGTLFDPKLSICNFPQNVECAKPELCQENPNGVYPDWEDCRAFYQCYHGKPSRMACGSDLYFNPDLGLCDWPDNVQCGIDYRSNVKPVKS